MAGIAAVGGAAAERKRNARSEGRRSTGTGRLAEYASITSSHREFGIEKTRLGASCATLPELRKAAIVIDVQKKVGALLGWPLPKADPEEKP